MVDARSGDPSREFDEQTVLGMSAQAGDCLISGLNTHSVSILVKHIQGDG